MEKVNFLVDGNYALYVDGRHIDLHNNFDLEDFEYSIKQNRASLSWVKTMGDWVQADEPEHVRIVFENVLFLKVQAEVSGNHENRGALSFIGYLHPEDVELMDGCLDESEATSIYHIIFAFEDGLVIKIFSDKATCLLLQNKSKERA